MSAIKIYKSFSELQDVTLTSVANDDFVQRKTGAWVNRTVAQVKSDLSLTGTNSGDQTITLTGDVTGTGTGSFAVTIANDAVTYAKMQNVSATARILGRKTAGAGDTEECTMSEVLDFISTTRGAILYRGASGWTALAPGTSTYVLTSNGTGADPSWQAASGGGATSPIPLLSAIWS
jgi:hypothetical protein